MFSLPSEFSKDGCVKANPKRIQIKKAKKLRRLCILRLLAWFMVHVEDEECVFSAFTTTRLQDTYLEEEEEIGRGK